MAAVPASGPIVNYIKVIEAPRIRHSNIQSLLELAIMVDVKFPLCVLVMRGCNKDLEIGMVHQLFFQFMLEGILDSGNST